MQTDQYILYVFRFYVGPLFVETVKMRWGIIIVFPGFETKAYIWFCWGGLNFGSKFWSLYCCASQSSNVGQEGTTGFSEICFMRAAKGPVNTCALHCFWSLLSKIIKITLQTRTAGKNRAWDWILRPNKCLPRKRESQIRVKYSH